MIVGFLGKGGSGKSTLSYGFIQHLVSLNKDVLAIDADHNMDLCFNFGHEEGTFPYVGNAFDNLHKYIGLKKGEHYSKVFSLRIEPKFSLSPPDSFTQSFSISVSEKVRLMATGPHNDYVLHGQRCSHSLSTPLKVYLPFLKLKKDEYAVVDEKASSDSVGTGIPTGFSCAVIVTEPTLYGVKAAKQIARLLQFYETPYIFVGNKIQNEKEKKFLTDSLPQKPSDFFKFSNLSQLKEGYANLLDDIKRKVKVDGDRRKIRTEKKFDLAREFASQSLNDV